MKPIIKWAGGKKKLAPLISKAFGGPCRGTYYEPFLGSASVFLHRLAHNELGWSTLSDSNGSLIWFYRCLVNDYSEFETEFLKLPRENTPENYRRVQREYNAEFPSVQYSAARFLWLNKACYNGLYRENASGQHNVPRGSRAIIQITNPEELRAFGACFKEAKLEACSFEIPMKCAYGDGEGQDQVYCDPPYVPRSNRGFTAYQGSGFGFGEQRKLAKACIEAANRGAFVVLSNHDLPVVTEDLYPSKDGFQVFDRPMVGRSIGRGTREPVREVILTIGERIS